MVLTSELKPFPYLFSLAITIVSFLALLLVITGRFGDGPLAGKLALIAVLLFLIALYGKATLNAKAITIDTSEQTVIFKDQISKSTKNFALSYFNGYSECRNFNALYGVHYDLYLIKDQKVIHSISSAFYSNYTELLECLSTIKDLGKFERTPVNEFKVFFGMTITKSKKIR